MEFIPPKQTTSTGLRIYFIRHAESLNNIRYNADPNKYKEARSHDPDLSLKGYEQATQLAAYIKGNEQFRDVCEIHCSAMVRSMLTCQFLQRELGINPEIWADLHGVKGCRVKDVAFPGMKRSEIENMFPGYIIPDQITEEGWFIREKTETREEEGWERAGRVWQRLKAMSTLEQYQGKSIIIVTHERFLDFLIGRLCKREMRGDRIEHIAVMPLMYQEDDLEVDDTIEETIED